MPKQQAFAPVGTGFVGRLCAFGKPVQRRDLQGHTTRDLSSLKSVTEENRKLDMHLMGLCSITGRLCWLIGLTYLLRPSRQYVEQQDMCAFQRLLLTHEH
jgi:hypothetical protein